MRRSIRYASVLRLPYKGLPIACLSIHISFAQQDLRLYDIIQAISAERIKQDVKRLTDFGTRHTLSDTISNTRGIGAARRWIKKEFETISKECNNCLNVTYQKNLVEKGKISHRGKAIEKLVTFLNEHHW